MGLGICAEAETWHLASGICNNAVPTKLHGFLLSIYRIAAQLSQLTGKKNNILTFAAPEKIAHVKRGFSAELVGERVLGI